MIVVYPLTIQHDYSELRYSLRSIEKYLKFPFEVVIVGDYVPEWLNNVTQINLPDIPGRKQLSIKRKILVALEYDDEILFMNDDVYLLKEQNFPYYYSGTLKNIAESGAKPLMRQLENINKPVKNFDGHKPLIYERGKFKEAANHFTDDCIIKSLYCNYWEIEGIEQSDCKIMKAMKPKDIREFIKDKPCFSTGSYSLKSALPVLQELFAKQSKYEI